jgi:hypothetical protein
MPATVVESVHRLIEQHGKGAVYAAVERLNQSIDEHDRPARDFWAQVVHAIHEFQRLVLGSKARAATEPSVVRAESSFYHPR